MDAAPEDIANSMQIECPACAACYNVPEDVVRPGRAMRCARCGETWTPRPVEPAPVAAAASLDAEPGPEGADDVGAAEAAALEHDAAGGEARSPLVVVPVRGGGTALVAAWVASGVVVLALALVVWHFHLRIERAWPPSQRLFGR